MHLIIEFSFYFKRNSPYNECGEGIFKHVIHMMGGVLSLVDCYASEDDGHKEWSNSTGKFAVHKTNTRGIRLLELATKHTFTIANTPHSLKDTINHLELTR